MALTCQLERLCDVLWPCRFRDLEESLFSAPAPRGDRDCYVDRRLRAIGQLEELKRSSGRDEIGKIVDGRKGLFEYVPRFREKWDRG
ncbi:MAG: hypothetical protein VYA48_08370, partial [Gemmatimonadota bacterium]|nr:hypothetical protein [Gemmatimonadota bacterium]